MLRRTLLAAAPAALGLFGGSLAAAGSRTPLIHGGPISGWTPSPAYRLLDAVLDVAAMEIEQNAARPTVSSRMIHVTVTAMYDAWAAYDPRALGVVTGDALRRPSAERTDRNQVTAMTHAGLHAVRGVFPEHAAGYAAFMRAEGYDPGHDGTDPARPEGIGRRVAEAVLARHLRDGANQLGDEVGSDGRPYSDYTFYRPVNSVDLIVDPDRWQPIAFQDGRGGTVTPGFLTPHWYRVRPFALARADQFRAPPPPLVGSDQMRREVEEVVAFNAGLTDEQRAIVEFMRDGPGSTGQSGHWLRFAQDVSRRDRHDTAKDIAMFLLVAATSFDAFISSWETKRYYDTSRPWTLVRHYYREAALRGWGGPGRGVVQLAGSAWLPYSPLSFITPPFPGYVSGHSAVSAACATALRLFTGSDEFGATALRTAGALTEPGYRDVDVNLPLPTFSATAEMAGISRVYGGYHIQADNVEGLALGRRVAPVVFAKVGGLLAGTA
jgi:hypothetical protein